jgi:hypothetical protein
MLSTYARIYIGLLPTLVKKIKQYSRQLATATTQAVLPITILPESPIQQALSHPQSGGLKTFMQTAYSDNIRVDNYISDSQASLEEQQIFIESTLYTLQSAKTNPNTSPAFQAKINDTMDSLNKQLIVLKSVGSEISASQQKSTEAKKWFGELIEKHDTEWTEFRDKHLKELHKAIDGILEDTGYHKLDPIPGGEVDNLMRQDLQETLDFYTDRAAKDLTPTEMEKMLGLKNPDVDTFFKIKAYLALRSVNPPLEERAGLMKKLETLFNQAKTEGQQLLDKQQKEVINLDNQNVKPILHTIESSHRQLKALETDRKAFLAPVTSAKLREEIEERIQQQQQPPPLEKKQAPG